MPKKEQARKQTGQKYVTQKDVAERAGVSTSIVSYVINNGPRKISEETRQRVLQAIAELNYHPNIHAQQLMRAGEESELAAQQFGVVISGLRSILLRPFYPRVLFGILEEATRHGLGMRFLMFMDELENPVTFNKMVHPEEVSALILISTGPVITSEQGITLTNRLRERVPNFVSVGWPNPQVANISYDLEDAVHQTTAYLLGLGHRRIAYTGTIEKRVDGYLRALQDAYLEADHSLVFDVHAGNTSDHGYRLAQHLITNGFLAGPTPVTAIVAASDELAWGLMRCFKEAGLRIPDDISITGIDNQVLSSYIVPTLTTVDLPMEEIGRLAVQTIVQRVAHPEEPAPTHILPTRLIVRESCAPYHTRKEVT